QVSARLRSRRPRLGDGRRADARPDQSDRSMRVTEGMKYSQVLSNLANITSQHAKAAQEASTGLRVSKPSDDPIAAAELARLSASSSQTKAHLATIDAV